jgi:hypothetical protein
LTLFCSRARATLWCSRSSSHDLISVQCCNDDFTAVMDG